MQETDTASFSFVVRRKEDGHYIREVKVIDDRTEEPIFTWDPKHAYLFKCPGCVLGHLRKMGRPRNLQVYTRRYDQDGNIVDHVTPLNDPPPEEEQP